MKKLLFILTFVVAVAAANAQVKFENASLNELLAKSVKENKPIFIDVYTTWCPPCKYMNSAIFPDKSLGEYMNNRFINAKFDAENGEGIGIAKRYGVKSYPTFIVLNSKGVEIARLVGSSQKPEDFKARLEKGVK